MIRILKKNHVTIMLKCRREITINLSYIMDIGIII